MWKEEVILITGGAFGVGRSFVESCVERYKPEKIIILDISEPTFENGIQTHLSFSLL